MHNFPTSTISNLNFSLSTVKELKVHDPGIAWQRQEPRWRLIEQLTLGTLGMQAAGRTYLPQEPKEEDDSYAARLARSICPPWLWAGARIKARGNIGRQALINGHG